MVRLGRADLGRRTQPERRSQPGAVADRFPAGSREAYGKLYLRLSEEYRARLAAQRLHSARGRRRDSGRERPQTV